MNINRGSYGITYSFTYLTAAGIPKDLTGFTDVYLVVWQPGNPQLVLLRGLCSISAPTTSGIVTYTSTATDFIQSGVYLAELQVEGTGINDPSSRFIINVKEAA
jgi:hypothetical protein